MIGPVGATARRLARWLGLAATPTFAIVALLTALAGGEPGGMLCGAGPWLSGMAPMYLLMSAFHSAAWLKLIAVVGARSAGKPTAGMHASSFETRARARSSG
ncbi:MAG TPA: hypothetical protein VNK51_20450 [Bradyrhizobium sp.]|nr:hypothetical protein [Bradyrhizobium sp.]